MSINKEIFDDSHRKIKQFKWEKLEESPSNSIEEANIKQLENDIIIQQQKIANDGEITMDNHLSNAVIEDYFSKPVSNRMVSGEYRIHTPLTCNIDQVNFSSYENKMKDEPQPNKEILNAEKEAELKLISELKRANEYINKTDEVNKNIIIQRHTLNSSKNELDFLSCQNKIHDEVDLKNNENEAGSKLIGKINKEYEDKLIYKSDEMNKISQKKVKPKNKISMKYGWCVILLSVFTLMAIKKEVDYKYIRKRSKQINMEKDYYEALEVDIQASQEIIEQKYRKLSKAW